MGTGDYFCVTLRGGAPWGFNLREGEGDFIYRPFLISQVEEGGKAFLGGVQEDDEVVSLNGEPCADLTLLRAQALIDTSIDCLQLLLKRHCASPSGHYGTEEKVSDNKYSSGQHLKSTTLHIFSPKHISQTPKEYYKSESQDDANNTESAKDRGFPQAPQLFCTQLCAPLSGDSRSLESSCREDHHKLRNCFSPGAMVELQLSLSEQTLDKSGCTSLGNAHGIEGDLSKREALETHSTLNTSQYVPSSIREPLGQHGVVFSNPSMLRQVEVILQQPAASASRRSIRSVGGRVGGPRVSGSVGSRSEGEDAEGHCEGILGPFSVSFGIPSEEGTPVEERVLVEGSDGESESDPDKPSKHRPRHARLRRSESLSEKQVKEAKSKCKRIALLLTTAPPNPNNKGVLMFKKHRQRAKKYTLVSYGTGEDQPEYSGEEDEESQDDKQGAHAIEFTIALQSNSDLNKHFLTDVLCSKSLLTSNRDKGLLDMEHNLSNQPEMECLPETKGKGALMFVQRRQRMDEISAEHDELRSKGLPVEGVKEVEKNIEPSYMQSTGEDHTYMDVNIHQQPQHPQQYQQYQEQQYYEQQRHYQQQKQYEQQFQQHQYEQQHYQQQAVYQQEREYHQEQRQIQNYSSNINGTVQQQTTEMQHSTLSNRTAKPFSAQNMAATPYYPSISGIDHDSMGQGEQIATRDERISTPAIRTGLLDSKRKVTGKPMFTFKEVPKVSPNPMLLNLLNRSDKKIGFESGPEEDYLSLGAEACNFLQSSQIKHKTPPPVAPKPVIDPNSPPWSAQIEETNLDTPQHAENIVSTPAAAPTTETAPPVELEPTSAPALEPSPVQVLQEAPANTISEEKNKLTFSLSESKQQQVIDQEENGHRDTSPQPETAVAKTCAAPQMQPQPQPSTISWQPAQVQPQESPPNCSPPKPAWVSQQPIQSHLQPQPPTNTWTSWNQLEEHDQSQAHVQASWTPPQEQSQPQTQVQPPWTPSRELQSHQMQHTWGQSQEPIQQQPHVAWAQSSHAETQPQPPWMQQTQQKSQPQPPWVHQIQTESQLQPPWAQPLQQQALQQTWPQAPTPGQVHPNWVSGHPQAQQQQPTINAWPASQIQSQQQPPWIQTGQSQPAHQTSKGLNPWAPVPAQIHSQPMMAPEHGQQPINSWGTQQSQAPHQPPWVQSVPQQPKQQQNWQPPAKTQPQTPASAWVSQSQQTPVKIAPSMLNTRPSPKPWQAHQDFQQTQSPPTPPQRMTSFTIGQRVSSPINPMAGVLNPSSTSSAVEMPAVRGKGADMFAKRQSRMEKFVVDSDTVEANKASRSTSPAASLPNEWKYTPNVRAPPPRAYNPIQSPLYPPAASKQSSTSGSLTNNKKKGKGEQRPAPKPMNVIEVMKHQPYQLDSSLFTFGPAAEARKTLPPKSNFSPADPPGENQPTRYEKMATAQPAGPFNGTYPQQVYGMPMQLMIPDGQYQQPSSVYPPTNAYQQTPGGPYQQTFGQHYQLPIPSTYQPQTPQSPNTLYQVPQASYQPANSPPYLAAPSVAYPQQPSSNVAPHYLMAPQPESISVGNPVSAPKPKFTAKKSSAQVWKPTAVEKD